jgi:hypothetical protein
LITGIVNSPSVLPVGFAKRLELRITFLSAGHAIDHPAAHDCFANTRLRTPARPVLKEVEDGGRQVMIGWQKPAGPRDDPVAVVVRVACERQIEAIVQFDQSPHREG